MRPASQNNCPPLAYTYAIVVWTHFYVFFEVFDAQLTSVPAAKDKAEKTRCNSQAGVLIGLKIKDHSWQMIA